MNSKSHLRFGENKYLLKSYTIFFFCVKIITEKLIKYLFDIFTFLVMLFYLSPI